MRVDELRSVVLCLGCFTLCCVVACAPIVEPADLVLQNGRLVTVDELNPEGQAMAILSDRIVAVGTNDEIDMYIGSETRVVDLEGRLTIPGFIEGHGHFLGIGDAKLQLNLADVQSWNEIVAMVQEAVKDANPDTLILGRGWHQDKWDRIPSPNVLGLPVHEALSEVSPNNPVILQHASGHAVFANARAMELAKINSQTTNPFGGEIVKDSSGDPIGMFRETAEDLLVKAIRDEIPTDSRRQAELAVEEVLSKGITSFQDAGSSFATVDLFKRMAEDGSLVVRLWVMLRESNEHLAEKLSNYRIINFGDNRLTVRAIKRSIDGALGTHGAWLLAPYTDLPQSSGLSTTSVDEIFETARLAMEHNFQLCVHAIGDKGNREVLNVFEEVFSENLDKSDVRWRVEHAQHLHSQDVPRFGELGVIASIQASHATSDGPWVTDRLGAERSLEGAYVWQKLMQSGAIVINGTDAPVEDVDPITSFYASVTRKLKDGSIFNPKQRMSRMEALRSYTLSAAYAAFEEDMKGSLTPGKLADITVLSKDIMTVPEEEILTAEVVYTIVGGEIVYDRDINAEEH